MLDVLRKARGRCVLMIGHNPGIADFAQRLVVTPPDHDRFGDYPTGATLVATFDAPDWAAVTWQTGRTIDFAIPRELTD